MMGTTERVIWAVVISVVYGVICFNAGRLWEISRIRKTRDELLAEVAKARYLLADLMHSVSLLLDDLEKAVESGKPEPSDKPDENQTRED